MARLRYAPLNGDETRPLVERIVRERGEVLHLYQMLLHSPPVAEGWLTFLTAIRQRSSLPGGLRELAIMRIAILNGAAYEADQHAPIALRAGVSQQQLDALADWDSRQGAYDRSQRAVLALTDAMTRDVHVPDDVWRAAKTLGPESLLVDLVATIAAYNMVSRFLVALQIHSADSPSPTR